MAIRRTSTKPTDKEALAAKRAELEAQIAQVNAGIEAEENRKRREAQAEQRAAARAARGRHQRMASTTRITSLTGVLDGINAALEHADEGARAEFIAAIKRLLAAT